MPKSCRLLFVSSQLKLFYVRISHTVVPRMRHNIHHVLVYWFLSHFMDWNQIILLKCCPLTSPFISFRSAELSLLSIPHTDFKTMIVHFSVAGPKLWNSLSLTIRFPFSCKEFKTSIKTGLFSLALYLL